MESGLVARSKGTLMVKSMSYMTRSSLLSHGKATGPAGERATNSVEQKASHKPTTPWHGFARRVSPVVDIVYFRQQLGSYCSRCSAPDHFSPLPPTPLSRYPKRVQCELPLCTNSQPLSPLSLNKRRIINPPG